jgi:hypothetical protein
LHNPCTLSWASSSHVSLSPHRSIVSEMNIPLPALILS